MKNLFLNKELSLLAKQKGFKEMCLRYWKKDKEDLFSPQRMSHMNSIIKDEFCPEDSYPAPLYQQIIDWFRHKHSIIIEVTFYQFHGKYIGLHYKYLIYKIHIEENEWGDYSTPLHEENSETDYYISLNKAIEDAFKLI